MADLSVAEARRAKKLARLRRRWVKAVDRGDGDRMFWLAREIARLEPTVTK